MARCTFLQKNINNNNPGEIVGDLTIDGDLTVTGTTETAILDTTGDANIGGSLVVTGNTTMSSLGVNVNANVTGTLTAGTLVGGSGSTIGGQNPNLLVFGGSIDISAPGNVAYFSYPRAGTIVGISAATQDAITVGNATLTAAINATPVTNGVVTLPLAGTVDGDIGFATPTAANVIALNDILSVTIGGTNGTATTANVSFTLSY